MSHKKPTYNELSSVSISDTRKAIISQHPSGGYTIAQKLEVEEGTGRSVSIFMKGAIQLATLDDVINLRDMLNEAIYQEENK